MSSAVVSPPHRFSLRRTPPLHASTPRLPPHASTARLRPYASAARLRHTPPPHSQHGSLSRYASAPQLHAPLLLSSLLSLLSCMASPAHGTRRQHNHARASLSRSRALSLALALSLSLSLSRSRSLSLCLSLSIVAATTTTRHHILRMLSVRLRLGHSPTLSQLERASALAVSVARDATWPTHSHVHAQPRGHQPTEQKGVTHTTHTHHTHPRARARAHAHAHMRLPARECHRPLTPPSLFSLASLSHARAHMARARRTRSTRELTRDDGSSREMMGAHER